MRETQRLESVVVLAIDDDVVRLVATALDRAEGSEAGQHRLAKVGDDHQRVEPQPIALADRVLAPGDVGAIGIANQLDRREAVLDGHDLVGRAVGVIPADDLGADADRMLGQPHPLGDVLLEDQAEAAALLEPIDLGSHVFAQRRVLDPLEKDVQFASDHAVSLPAATATFGHSGAAGKTAFPRSFRSANGYLTFEEGGPHGRPLV